MARTNLLQTLSSATYRFTLAFGVLLFVLPFGNQYVTNSALTLVLFNSIISLKPIRWLQAFGQIVFWLPAVFYGYLALTLLWSGDTANGALQLETKLSLLLAPWVLAANQTLLTSKQRDVFLKVFVLGNVVTLLLALGVAAKKALAAGSMGYLTESGKTVSFFTYTELSSGFMHPGYLSTYVGIAILIALYFLLQKQKFGWYWFAIAFFLFGGLILLQGRINLLALLVVLGIGGLIAAIRAKKYSLLLVPAIPVVAFGLFVIFGSPALKARYLQMPDFKYDISGSASDFNSATYRLAEWTCALDVIAQHPVVGVGIGSNKAALLDAYENRGFYEGLKREYNAHNQFLETTIVGGGIGLILLVVLIGGYIWLAYKNQDYFLIAALAFFALSMLTESMFERAWAVILYAIFFPLLLLISAQGATKSSA